MRSTFAGSQTTLRQLSLAEGNSQEYFRSVMW
jgi:hypothetical protein